MTAATVRFGHIYILSSAAPLYVAGRILWYRTDDTWCGESNFRRRAHVNTTRIHCEADEVSDTDLLQNIVGLILYGVSKSNRDLI